MDLLTDSLALVGQHGVYCRSERFPGKPKMDIALVLEQLHDYSGAGTAIAQATSAAAIQNAR